MVYLERRWVLNSERVPLQSLVNAQHARRKVHSKTVVDWKRHSRLDTSRDDISSEHRLFWFGQSRRKRWAIEKLRSLHRWYRRRQRGQSSSKSLSQKKQSDLILEWCLHVVHIVEKRYQSYCHYSQRWWQPRRCCRREACCSCATSSGCREESSNVQRDSLSSNSIFFFSRRVILQDQKNLAKIIRSLYCEN